jgi:hypothetical protein
MITAEDILQSAIAARQAAKEEGLVDPFGKGGGTCTKEEWETYKTKSESAEDARFHFWGLVKTYMQENGLE